MSTRELKIGDHWIGDSHPCFITYEAGPTHDGMETAIGLVREAAKAGANAIKFQIFDADKLVENKDQLFDYKILLDKATNDEMNISEPLYDILKRRQLNNDEWRKVKAVADSLNLAFFATIGFEEDLDLLIDLKVDSVKIASADLDHYPLLRLAARSGMNVQIDTGSSELREICDAVALLESEGCNSIIIHQCPSGYPARLESIYLKMIPTLRNMFPSYPIAYSDHTPDADMDIAAVALGANLVEKTITFDRCTPSVEHIFSLEPDEMTSFIQRLRSLELAMGLSERKLSEVQIQKRKLLRRSPYLVSAAQAGDSLNDLSIEFRRPQIGMSPKEYDERCMGGGHAINVDLESGKVIDTIQFVKEE